MHSKKTRRPPIVFLTTIAVFACDASDDVCVPGAQRACACAGEVSGAQTCNADGTGYDTCSCSDAGGGSTSTAGGAPNDAGAGQGAAPGVGAGPGTGAAPGVGAGPQGGAPPEGGNTTIGSGGSEPATCIGMFPSFCTIPDPNLCTCLGCNATCEASDCVCPACVSDEFCSSTSACNYDNQCDPWNEGCSCSDCFEHPECP